MATAPVTTATTQQAGSFLSTCQEGVSKVTDFCRKQFSSCIAYAKPFASRSYVYCKANPWQAVGFAILALVIIGTVAHLFGFGRNTGTPATPAPANPQTAQQVTAAQLAAEAQARVNAQQAQ